MKDRVEIGPDNKNWTKSQRKEPLMRPEPVERGRSKQFHTLSRDRSCNQKRPPKLKVSFGTAWIRRLFNFLLRVLPICELSTPALL